MSELNFVAAGQINQARFVTPVAGAINNVAQSVTNDSPIGISGLGTRRDPDPDFAAGSSALALAIAGDPIEVNTHGEYCLLELAASASGGQYLRPDDQGKGIVANTSTSPISFYGARALQDGVAGDFILVQVLIGAVL